MPRLTYSLRPCSKGSSMLRPTDSPRPSRAPILAASIVPGPPPVMTAKPRRASSAARARAASYIGSGGRTRAEPKKVTAGPSVASASKPATNSAWIRSTRQGSLSRNSGAPSGRSSSLRSSICRSTPRRTIPPVRRSPDSSPMASLTLTAAGNDVETGTRGELGVRAPEHPAQPQPASGSQPIFDLVGPDECDFRPLGDGAAIGKVVVDFETRPVAVEGLHPHPCTRAGAQPIGIGQLGRQQAGRGQVCGSVPQTLHRLQEVGGDHHQSEGPAETEVFGAR